MKIAIGADKNGIKLREALIEYLTNKGHEIIDFGTVDVNEPKPHTVAAPAVARAIQKGEAERGILICGTGMGMSIVANKFKGIYAAVVESVYAAEYCRKINDANVLCFGAFIVGEVMAKEMVDVFLETDFVEGFEQWRIDFLNQQMKVLSQLEDETFK
jgi:ribose 5-phosphate isomerase B